MSLQRKGPIDPSEYAHLTQKERMNAGYPYIPWDDELTRDRARARKLIREFNATDEEDVAGQRAALEKLFNPECRGRKFIIEKTLHVDYGYNITHGENLQMNFDCVILDCAPVTIGDNVLFAPGVHIYAATHPLNARHRKDNDDYYELAFPVKIGNNVWIGGKAVICPGVVVGDNSVIGAGSVVVKDVPPNTVVAGNPAKVIRHIDDDTNWCRIVNDFPWFNKIW